MILYRILKMRKSFQIIDVLLSKEINKFYLIRKLLFSKININLKTFLFLKRLIYFN